MEAALAVPAAVDGVTGGVAAGVDELAGAGAGELAGAGAFAGASAGASGTAGGCGTAVVGAAARGVPHVALRELSRCRRSGSCLWRADSRTRASSPPVAEALDDGSRTIPAPAHTESAATINNSSRMRTIFLALCCRLITQCVGTGCE